VASASQQCSRPHSIECEAVSHDKRDDSGFILPLLPGPVTLRFFLFLRMKRDLKGKRFQNLKEVGEKTTEALKAITLEELQNCFEQWKKQWDKCMDTQGEYFEGD
jgi:hypothetical protein